MSGFKGTILIIGPSGVGKSTLLSRLCGDFPQKLIEVITCTTRPKRGDDDLYIFLSPEDFEEKIKQGYFAEWERVYKYLYGTPMEQLQRIWQDGKVAILDVDVKGALTLTGKLQNTLSVFIQPPTLQALEKRILQRKQQITPEQLKRRLSSAKWEISQAKKFNFTLVNEDLEQTYSALKKIVENYV